MDNIDKSTSTSNDSITGTAFTRKFETDKHAQRNETTRRVRTETLRILSWESPIRSAVILAMSVGSILLTQSYSLLQIISFSFTTAITVNLIYVYGIKFFQSVVADHPAANPYASVLESDGDNLLNRENAVHYSSIIVDISETVARAIVRIVLIEDPLKSMKWLVIFFITWNVSAYVSSRSIILFFTISAFIAPRLYVSNKDLIDARIQQSQAIINTQLQQAQEYASTKLCDLKDQYKKKVNETSSTTTKKDE